MDTTRHPDARILKAGVRMEMLARRNALSLADRISFGSRVVDRVMAHERVRAAGTVLLYWAIGSEMMTAPLIEAMTAEGKRVALPHMTSVHGSLLVAEYAPGDPVDPGPYKVPQPLAVRTVPVDELEVIAVPGVAFDLAGRRIGYGKGYYDRFLSDPALRAWILGIGYELQLCETVPFEPHDRSIDALATEARVLTFDGPT